MDLKAMIPERARAPRAPYQAKYVEMYKQAIGFDSGTANIILGQNALFMGQIFAQFALGRLGSKMALRSPLRIFSFETSGVLLLGLTMGIAFNQDNQYFTYDELRMLMLKKRLRNYSLILQNGTHRQSFDVPHAVYHCDFQKQNVAKLAALVNHD